MKHVKTQLIISTHGMMAGVNKDEKHTYYSKFQKLGRDFDLPESPAEYEFLANIEIPIKKGFKINGITPDFKVIGKNIVIEIDGRDFHNNKKDKERDDIYFKNRYFVIRVEASILYNKPKETCDYVRRVVNHDLLVPYKVEYVNKSNIELPQYLIERELIVAKTLTGEDKRFN